MSNSVYKINKGVNKAVEFRGLKAQYIVYLAAGLIGLLLLFSCLYLVGVNVFVCVGLVLTGGSLVFFLVYRMSHRYGEHGLMKKWARRRIPRLLKAISRKPFIR
jgi:hypothetical protein